MNSVMTSCGCPQQEVTVVLHIPIACVHKRGKVKKQVTRVMRPKTAVCDDCRSLMAAQDDGWQIDMETNGPCGCQT
ncbi:MAG TPA: hypothetical protein VN256_23830 [Pyrinomonadaceae bacterium]|nr:hypothetical protein [Pyrinomonadaceae bacterium]